LGRAGQRYGHHRATFAACSARAVLSCAEIQICPANAKSHVWGPTLHVLCTFYRFRKRRMDARRLEGAMTWNRRDRFNVAIQLAFTLRSNTLCLRDRVVFRCHDLSDQIGGEISCCPTRCRVEILLGDLVDRTERGKALSQPPLSIIAHRSTKPFKVVATVHMYTMDIYICSKS
jgi:hypothetical protein